jgi:hypothetical protein
MVHRLLSAVLGLSLILGALPARAEPLDPAVVDPTLKGLAFGMTKDQVVLVLKRRAADRYDAQLRSTMDIRDRDRLTREKDAALAAAGTDVVAFDGAHTGWDSSVIRGEFAHGLAEEMIHVKEGEVQLYLFFWKGTYYKLIRTPGARDVADVAAELKAAYGAPATTVWHDAKAKKGVTGATWKAGTLTVRVDDQAALFQCAPVRWALASVDASVQAEWAKDRHADGLNPLIREAQKASADEVDPVDAMIGAPPPKAPPAPKKAKPRPKPVAP